MNMLSPHFRLAIFEIPLNEEAYLRQSALAEYDLFFHPAPLKPANLPLAKDAEVLSVFIYSRIGQAELEHMPQLKLIATRSTGFDHVDLAVCRERNITVTNVPFYGENTVAEHTFGLHVIRMAKGFGMNVLAYDVRQDHFLAEVLDFAYAPLEELLAQADVISLHAPYNARTHHLINRDTLKLAKRGAILINTSRGALVDTAALVWALDEGILAGAGLDVLEGEDLIKEEKQLLASNEPAEKLRLLLSNHILRHRENVVITPHSAFNSREALNRILDTTVANILAFAADKPINIVRD